MAQQHINRSSPNDGLGDTLYNQAGKIEDNFTELYTNKVDKVFGYGLSENNFSDADKTKLDGLIGGVQADWNQGDSGEPDYINNKPTDVSEFTNDAEYIPDVAGVGVFGRSVGVWVDMKPAMAGSIFDGVIGVTAGFAVGQTAFTLPAGAKCVDVWLSHAKQYRTTLNNASLTNRWSQAGDVVTITKSPVLNNYLYIEYIP